jgi:hypothetical protein
MISLHKTDQIFPNFFMKSYSHREVLEPDPEPQHCVKVLILLNLSARSAQPEAGRLSLAAGDGPPGLGQKWGRFVTNLPIDVVSKDRFVPRTISLQNFWDEKSIGRFVRGRLIRETVIWWKVIINKLLKGPWQEVFDLWFFLSNTPLGPWYTG